MSKHIDIPVVDLEEFVFSPPGAMGWSESEYQRVMDEEPDASMTNFSNLYNIRKESKQLNVLPPVGEIDLEETYTIEQEETHKEPIHEPVLEEVPQLEETEVEETEEIEEEEKELVAPHKIPEVVLNYKLKVKKLSTTPSLNNKKNVKQSSIFARG
ncbi:hypothetical protein ACSVDE_03035 [Pseudalkalibacillus sp. Hm43]|uniref:hypothetical protein n=1 Tax=Pseudalkalibacillus sp. Hm43 TaxID=3450742 RepID=UPI003F44238B